MNKNVDIAVSFPGRRPLKDPRREKFCMEYSRHGERQRAVVSAGFNCKTWAQGSTSASALGCKLLKEADVLERIMYLQEHRARQADMDEINLIKELRNIAFFNMGDLYHPDGSLKSVKDWPPSARKAVGEVEVEKLFKGPSQIGVTAKVKTHSKIKAIEKLMEFYQMIQRPAESGPTNIENQQVNFYLPENPRHVKTVNGSGQQVQEAHAETEQSASNSHGIELPPKSNGSH